MTLSHATKILLTGLVAISISGCAIFEDYVGDGPSASARVSDEQRASLSELQISTGRYGVMLGQVREILKLPDTAGVGSVAGDASISFQQERAALAHEQASVINEFVSDTRTACKHRRTSRKLRILACAQERKVREEWRKPGASDLPALTKRDEDLGLVIMVWWDAVCAAAPRPRDGEPHACAIE